MHFHKYPYPANFEFVAVSPSRPFKTNRGNYRLSVRTGAEDVYHLRITGKGWEANDSAAGLRFPKKTAKDRNATRLLFDESGSVRLQDREGNDLLSTLPGRFFGQCGAASLFEFLRQPGDQFYGLGEKWSGFEHSGKKTKFWNTDVWADFHPQSYIDGRPPADPVYVSIPYLVIKRGNTYLGLLMDNPGASFVYTGLKVSIAGQMDLASNGKPDGFVHLGAEEGQPNLYLLYGPSLPELTRKMQKLIGTTPLPPAWALGYHQCRWGYQSEADLLDLDAQFRKHGIPADGLWLDIDYMDGYRVFTFAKKHFRDPAKAMSKLAKLGRKVIPILDPGVKFEKGYGAYERGHAAEAFCQNPQGREYVGLVWPGETVFPDFSLKSAREWWAREVGAFAKSGIYGAWLDMNDPATGPVENQDMLFDRGRKPHAAYHNQYGLGMAMATRQGFLDAHPGERPFLLSRSGFTGSNRYTAIWTGDNYSNYHHLKNSIATTLNLALSGIPFNGPDAGGFAGDTTPELIRDWYKCGFLFPVLRNHSSRDSRRQEPWAFDQKTLAVLRRYIQLRYRFRPYLYQLFAEHERSGEAILRPLFYDFPDTKALPLGLIDDQFLVGPSVMQAPFVAERQRVREVVLPGNTAWFDAMRGRWIEGGQKISATADFHGTPLYLRDQTLLPLARLSPGEHAFQAERADFHLFLSKDGVAQTRYLFDDGRTFAYLQGKRSEVEITAERSGKTVDIQIAVLEDGFGAGDFTFTTQPGITKVRINGVAATREARQGIPVGKEKGWTWKAGAAEKSKLL
ncbi:MAG: TIM-barrel domain-containing protein [Verrucomicrobiota bacterium]